MNVRVRFSILLVFLAGVAWTQPASETKPEAAAPIAQQSGTVTAPAATAKQTPAAQVPVTLTPAQAAAAAQAAMAASIAKQKESVKAQASSVSHKPVSEAAAFFTAPWVDAPAPSAPGAFAMAATNIAMCDPLPTGDLDKLITESAQRESVRADLIRAVIGEESANRPCAVSTKGAQGLMQLMPATAEQFGVKDPFDPKQNVDGGTRLLKQLLDKYGGDLAKTLSAYNAGSVRVDDADGVPPIAETENYVADILSKLSAQ